MAWWWGELGGPGAVEALSQVLLDDDHTAPRRKAAKALGKLGDSAGREALEQVIDGGAHLRVKLEAQRALKQL